MNESTRLLGQNIRKCRKRAGISQQLLADMLNLNNRTISSWETGRSEPKMEMIERICTTLNCKKSEIVGMNYSSDDVQYNGPLPSYYKDAEAMRYAQIAYEHPEYRVLFDAAIELKSTDIKKAVKAINLFLED